MSPVYSEAFKLNMLKQMVGPNAKSAVQLAAETGVGHSTLSHWLEQANSVQPMPKKGDGSRSPVHGSKPEMSKRPEDWTAEEKLQAVLEASALSDEELGEFLRARGLHQVPLNDWRASVLESLGKHPRAKKKSSESKRVKQLERELRRKDKALAEAAALLVLQKKVQAIWGDEDDDTEPKSDE